MGGEKTKTIIKIRIAAQRRKGHKNVQPKKAELVVDEMLAICSDIARWRDKKESERANAAYNEILYFGLENMPDE